MNILLISAGRRSYIVNYFKESLGGNGLVHAGNSEYSAALHIADRSVITPLIYDSGYIDFIINYCKQNNIKAIIPLFDIDLPVLAMARERIIDESIIPIVSNIKVVSICNDKWLTFKFLMDNGFKSPETFIDIETTEKKIKDGIINFPLIVKPRWGMGSIGIYTAENFNELQVLYKKVKSEIFNTYLAYESSTEKEKAVIIQEKIKGDEYGLDVVNDLKSDYVVTFVKKKLGMRSGETDRAITEQNVLLEETGRALSRSLGHIANLDVDCFMVDNKPCIVEMNSRFGGGYPFSHLAGADIPQAIIKWITGEEPPRDIFKIQYGVESIKDIHPLVLKRNS